MATIEDLLNETDSEGEVELGLDLEQLLLASDSDSEDATVTVTVTASTSHSYSHSNSNSHSHSGAVSGQSYAVDKSVLQRFSQSVNLPVLANYFSGHNSNADEEASKGASIVNSVGNSAENLLLSDALQDNDSDSNSNYDAGAGTKLQTALELAVIREENSLKCHTEIVSALQAKRNRCNNNHSRNNASDSAGISSAATIASSNIKIDEMLTITNQLKRNANYRQHGPGAALSVCVTSKFIAVGTTKGLVILFDHGQEIRQVLGSSAHAGNSANSKTVTGVSAIEANTNCSVLICGHVSGEITVWDVHKGVTIKRVDELHKSTINKITFLRSISDGVVIESNNVNAANSANSSAASAVGQAETSYKLSVVKPSFDISFISVDSSGIMNRVKISKNLWNNLAMDSDCLLDGQAGMVTDAVTLPSIEKYWAADMDVLRYLQTNETKALEFVSNNSSMQLMAFNFIKETCIVSVAPTVRIVHRWAITRADSMNDTNSESSETKTAEAGTGASVVAEAASSIDWNWIDYCDLYRYDHADQEISEPEKDSAASIEEDNGEAQRIIPALARCSGNKVEMLILNDHGTSRSDIIPSAFKLSANSNTGTSGSFSYAVVRERVFTTVFITIKWLDPTRIALLSKSDIIILNLRFNTIDKCPLAGSLQLSMQVSNKLDAKNLLSSQSTSEVPAANKLTISKFNIVVSNKKLYLLESESLSRFQLQSCFESANQLIHEGQWLEALALILDNIEKSPSLLKFHTEEVNAYIRRYVELAVRQPTISFTSNTSSDSTMNRNHYHLVAGVSIEYCITAKAHDLLFNDLYRIFSNVQQQLVFLQSLEVYILSKAIYSLPQNILKDFLEFSAKVDSLSAVEKCLAFLELKEVDISMVTRFTYEKKLYSGLLYTYSQGTGDYNSAFALAFDDLLRMFTQCLLENSSDNVGVNVEEDVHPNFATADLGYKLMVFLQYTFEGKVFPRGGNQPWNRTVCMSLIELVTSKTYSVPCPVFAEKKANHSTASNDYFRNFSTLSTTAPYTSMCKASYPYLTMLSQIDVEALYLCLSKGLLQMQSYYSSQASSISYSATNMYGIDNKITHNYDIMEDLYANNKRTITLTEIFDNIYDYSLQADASATRNREIGGKGRKSTKLQDLYFTVFGSMIDTSPIQLSIPIIQATVEAYNNKPLSQRKATEGKVKSLVELQAKYHRNSKQLKSILQEKNFWIASMSLKAVAFENMSQYYEKALTFYCTVPKEVTASNVHVSANVSAQNDAATSNINRMNSSEDSENYLLLDSHLAFTYITAQFHHISSTIADNQAELKEKFCRVIVSLLLPLAKIDLDLTKYLVLQELSKYVIEIIASTAADSCVQYQLLNAIIESIYSDDSHAVRGGSRKTDPLAGSSVRELSLATTAIGNGSNIIRDLFDSESIVTYINLLSQFNANNLYDFLLVYAEDDVYPLDEVLAIVKEKNLSESTALLIDRSGDDQGALSILLHDIASKIKVIKRNIDTQLRQQKSGLSSSNSSSNSFNNGGLTGSQDIVDEKLLIAQILSKVGSTKTEIIQRLPLYQQLLKLLNCASDLCKKYATKNNSSSMWFQVFDHLLQERQQVRSGLISSSSEIIIVIIGLLLQALTAKMKGTITSQEIIRRITTQGAAAGIKIGEFRDVLIGMLEANSYDLQLYKTVNDIIQKEQGQLHCQKIDLLRKACYRSDGPIVSNSHEASPSKQVIKQSNSASTKIKNDDGKSLYNKMYKGSATTARSWSISTGAPTVVDSKVFEIEPRKPGSLYPNPISTGEMFW